MERVRWEEDAARRVFHYCGGHPLVSRYFASHACEQGTRKEIDLARVEQSAEELRRDLRRNDIGNYYQEGVWIQLRSDEQELLTRLLLDGQGSTVPSIGSDFEEALTNLENFGLVVSDEGQVRITADLFASWLKRRTLHERHQPV